MAKYTEWLEPENLERVTNWAANGCTNAEVAANMGVNVSTLRRWMKSHGAICAAIKKGRCLARESIENALFAKATGKSTVTTTVEEFKGELLDGKPHSGAITRRTETRQLPPDTGAIIFYLKNRCPDRYSDRRTVQVETDPERPLVVLGIEPARAATE